MPTYKITGPDGKVYRVTGDGTAEEALAQVQAKIGGTSIPAEQPKPAETKESPLVLGELPFARSITKNLLNAVPGALRGAGSIGAVLRAPPSTFLKSINQTESDMDSALQGLGADTSSPGFKLGKFGTEVAGTLGLGPALGGGAAAMRAPASLVDALTSYGLTSGATKGALGYGTRVLGGGISGGAAGGLLDPESAGTSAAISAAVPGVVVPVIRGGASAIEGLANKVGSPLLDLVRDEGAANVLRRYITSAVGKNNVPATVNAARNASTEQAGPGMYSVANYPTTTAEAMVGVPEGSALAALQNLTSRTKGDNVTKFGKIKEAGVAAIDSAKKARSAESAVNYGKAFDTAINNVKGDPELAVLASDPFFKDAIPAAMKLAKAKGITPKDNLTEVLHDVKLGLDRKLEGGIGEEALSAAQYKQIQSVKSKLVDWMAKHNKDYDVGRATHAARSRGITSVEDRAELMYKPPQPTSLGGGVNIADETRAHIPNLLSRTAMASNFALKTLGGRLEPKIDEIAANIFSSPKAYADFMSKVPPELRFNVDAALRKSRAMGLTGPLVAETQ